MLLIAQLGYEAVYPISSLSELHNRNCFKIKLHNTTAKMWLWYNFLLFCRVLFSLVDWVMRNGFFWPQVQIVFLGTYWIERELQYLKLTGWQYWNFINATSIAPAFNHPLNGCRHTPKPHQYLCFNCVCSFSYSTWLLHNNFHWIQLDLRTMSRVKNDIMKFSANHSYGSGRMNKEFTRHYRESQRNLLQWWMRYWRRWMRRL